MFAEDDELGMADHSPTPSQPMSDISPNYSPFSSSSDKPNYTSKNVELFAAHVMKGMLQGLLNSSLVSKMLKKKLALNIWRKNMQEVTSSKHLKETEAESKMFLSLKKLLETTSKFRSCIVKKKFYDWVNFVVLHKLKEHRDKELSKLDNMYTREVSEINKQMSVSRKKQSEIENIIAYQSEKEHKYVRTIEELSNQPKKQNEQTKTKIIKELERENQLLRNKIEAVEKNINCFISEMSSLIEQEENYGEQSRLKIKI